ncbi:alpha,alpha-trehalase TreF [Fulvimonas soli]|uniref:Putative periplasmic trehalase n=1 Tax=Fulvimonas soli TaxID=155197 RepID=A0A316HPU8_9GAMM|nr:alpha,alpha-trehalase TreF [Fulvimonas soli]PWK82113.1 alpha,alpha-trehalase [Fulvimonas soli]TNY27016.1 alpha,alpha-trehalase [Fulvimonas soli]
MSGAERERHEAAARAAQAAPADPLTPADRYRELFEAVQLGRVFEDSKTFVDCAPKRAPEAILQAYRRERGQPGFDLAAFVRAHFAPPRVHRSHYVSPPGQPLREHIDGLWDVLTRHPAQHPPHGSLLPLPNAYVVPGGRFGELYYWDSYFTMLGLAESGRGDLLRAMADNFAYLIDAYGHVPNGNRSYYLSRSQPPVFVLMVELFERHGICKALRYLPQLRREHAFWTADAGALRPGEARGHCVRLEDGRLLNRYWDARDAPREEAHLEDVTTARRSPRPARAVYRELRAGAASGWDFSSRWCDGDELSGIRTTAILPVDLNALLWKLEAQIALLSAAAGDAAQAARFRALAQARRETIDRVLWNARAGAYLDYDFERGAPREALTAAAAMPLYVGAADPGQAARTGAALRARLLRPGGLDCTERVTPEQWDSPNGWAPLQWLAIGGLRRYGDPLADEIASRWLHTVANLYRRESKLVEKYVLVPQDGEIVGGGGGEYPLQDGFGWTNGVTRRLLHEDPAHPGNRSCAGRR